ncbi:MAG: XrtA system polysaccharide deacetylase [Candidatus Altiarchaeota archaeon]
MLNYFSVDVEDWFCVSNLSRVIDRRNWDSCELRVGIGLNQILDLLEIHKVKATFFVLGWIAERVPDLIRKIDEAGHEIGIHGYGHSLLSQMDKEEFRIDVGKALDCVRDCGVKQKILGYRAPSFTLKPETFWALEVLEEYGLKYDSSVFPISFHPDYGVPDAPLKPYKISAGITEFPLSCAEFFGMRLPCSGGGYFRIFPYAYTRYCIRNCNNNGRPVVFYIHPWELDPGQPRVELPLTKRFRHYRNLGGTRGRLERLLDDFRFTCIREGLEL